MQHLILGIGNLLWADEGFGVRMVEILHQRYQFPENVQLLDGGTQGLYLLQYLQAADRVLIFDAIDYALPAGTIKVVRDSEVPSFMGVKKMSLHQTGFQEVLAAAQLTNRYPNELVLIGVQPAVLEDYGGSLTDIVKAQIEPCIALALAEFERWGIQIEPRQHPVTEAEALSPLGLEMQRYETNRPTENEACRFGDERVLAWREQKS